MALLSVRYFCVDFVFFAWMIGKNTLLLTVFFHSFDNRTLDFFSSPDPAADQALTNCIYIGPAVSA
ncbi:MAG TPA: hypothetical protein VKR41_06280, partial [Puia sp.]|nr:hypothetical protein [Puia sp.]